MKYDWNNLKVKFITKLSDNNKYTLKQFSIDENISYSLLRKRAKGWIDERGTKQEQKASKIIDKTIDAQVDKAVEMNMRHYNAGETLLEVMIKTMGVEELVKSPKSIAVLAKALKDVQHIQRLATGIDDNNASKASLVDEFVEAVEAVHNEQN